MARTRKPKTAARPASKDLASLLERQANHFLRAQEEIASEAENFTSRWIERRHDAAQAVLKTASEFKQTEPASGMVPAVLRTWQRKSIECIAEDASDWIALWGTCARTIASGEIEAQSDLVKMVGMTNQDRKLPTRIPV